MNTESLSSPQSENIAISPDSDRFYRLTNAEVIHFRAAKFKPSHVNIYCYIKTIDPFGNGVQISYTQIATALNYHKRTVQRAIKALVTTGELALGIVEAHVKIVAAATASVAEIVAGLGQKPDTPEQREEPVVEPVATNSQPPTTPSPTKKSGCSAIGDLLSTTAELNDIAQDKTEQWMAQIERQLELLGIQLSNVNHALKKYPVNAIEAALAHTKKQTWATSKAGVFVNFLKQWTPNTATVYSQPSSTTPSTSKPRVETALMKRFPEEAYTLSLENNPVDEETLDYFLRLEADGKIYRTHYSTIHNYFGVMITQRDYPHAIPWWEAIKMLTVVSS